MKIFVTDFSDGKKAQNLTQSITIAKQKISKQFPEKRNLTEHPLNKGSKIALTKKYVVTIKPAVIFVILGTKKLLLVSQLANVAFQLSTINNMKILKNAK